jgi:hypothetical protein
MATARPPAIISPSNPASGETAGITDICRERRSGVAALDAMMGTMVQAPGLSPTGAWPDQPFVLRILRRVGALTMVSDLSKA